MRGEEEPAVAAAAYTTASKAGLLMELSPPNHESSPPTAGGGGGGGGDGAGGSSSAGASSSAGGGAATPQTPSRYEAQKRRDWNTFGQYLRNHRPPLGLAQCSGAHVLEFLRYLDQFGRRSLDALVGRLRAAFEENGGRPESNPFAVRAVRLYLREVREHQARARGVSYEKKKRKKPQPADTSGGGGHPHPAAGFRGRRGPPARPADGEQLARTCARTHLPFGTPD
ncbi:hypothetical protein OsJ_07578 [Oryza sativa Japonica Group]|uniref:ALOG domain-containing protein n=1 Tax=Oryza sativa subsp. japonica TaxID=39947 RepID=B9F158_ORYSJ|nr:hypothetical protein OsJ_07578 [Oryza sativa Japonica Group]